MAERIPARLRADAPYGARDGRRFGGTVGAAFLLLAAVSRWRGHVLPPWILGAIGGALVLGALIAPVRLRLVERAWMRLALAISRVTTPIFLGVVYFLVLTPVGLLRRALGKSAIAVSRDARSYWLHRPSGQRQSDLDRQF